jgi:hypothetical protein
MHVTNYTKFQYVISIPILTAWLRNQVKTPTVYFGAQTGEDLVSGVITAIQTLGNRSSRFSKSKRRVYFPFFFSASSSAWASSLFITHLEVVIGAWRTFSNSCLARSGFFMSR